MCEKKAVEIDLTAQKNFKKILTPERKKMSNKISKISRRQFLKKCFFFSKRKTINT